MEQQLTSLDPPSSPCFKFDLAISNKVKSGNHILNVLSKQEALEDSESLIPGSWTSRTSLDRHPSSSGSNHASQHLGEDLRRNGNGTSLFSASNVRRRIHCSRVHQLIRYWRQRRLAHQTQPVRTGDLAKSVRNGWKRFRCRGTADY